MRRVKSKNYLMGYVPLTMSRLAFKLIQHNITVNLLNIIDTLNLFYSLDLNGYR